MIPGCPAGLVPLECQRQVDAEPSPLIHTHIHPGRSIAQRGYYICIRPKQSFARCEPNAQLL